MSLVEELARERRARLAAERLLELKQKELLEANKQLSHHALALSDEIREQREEAEIARHVAEELRDEKRRALRELEQATEETDIARRRLWHSVETIRDGFAVFDRHDRLVVANPAYLSIFDGMEMVAPGISYAEILRLMVEEGIIDPEDMSPGEWQEFMLRRWADPRRKPHTIKLWDRRFIRLVDRTSSTGDTVSLCANVTATIRREAELKEALLRAEAANRAKSAFLAKMSHELRTPLNGVVGMADLLAETRLDEEQKLFVDTIRNSGNALLELINNVLDFSKMEADRLALHKEAFDLEQTLRDVLILFHPVVTAKGIDLAADYDIFLPTCFVSDQGRIRQILTNLIGNAVKFTESGHVLVRVVGLAGDDDDDRFQIHVSVEDTGPGIPADKLDHVFGEFNQVEDERNRRHEGTGLGLAISRQLVTLLGGEIWVESTPGKGSCFGFRVPMPMAGENGFELPRLPEWIRRISFVHRGTITAEILQTQMHTLGVEIEPLSAEAFAASQGPIAGDVLLIEAGRSHQEREQLLQALRALPGPVPTIIMQSHGNSGDIPPELPVICLGQPVTIRSLAREMWALRMPATTRKPARESPAGTPGTPEAALSTAPTPPPAAEADEPRPPAAGSGQADRQTAADARRMRILAAEDNRTNRLIFSKLVKGLNISLEFAENGAEAVEKWESFRPDLLFMDISMPLMDGKEATARIRAAEERLNRPRTPIVALTAHALSGDGTELLAAGLDHYLTKPLKKKEIFERIRAAAPAGAEPVFPEDDASPDSASPARAGAGC